MLDREDLSKPISINKSDCIYKLMNGICCLLSNCKCATVNKECYLYNLIDEDDYNPFKWMGE